MPTGFRLMAVRATLRTVGHLSPDTAARWAEELFFRPRKARPRPHEEEFQRVAAFVAGESGVAGAGGTR